MTEPTLPKPDTVRKSGPLRVVFGLIVVPLLVVLLCVGVFIGFGWIAYDRQTTTDYLNDLQSWWKPRRVPRWIGTGRRTRTGWKESGEAGDPRRRAA